MTLPTFRQQAAADFDAVFRNVNEFAEAVTYLPAGSLPSRSVVVNIVELEAPQTDGDRQVRSQSIEVSIGRNPNAALGGVLRPLPGDAILRSPAIDPLQRPFAWCGEVTDSTPDEWVLRFNRTVTTDVGGQRSHQVR